MLAAATGEGREANARALANSLVESDLIALALATHGVLRFANPAFCTLFGRSGGVVGIRQFGAHRYERLELHGGSGQRDSFSVAGRR